MENDNYYLLTLAAIAKEIQQRGEKRECAVNLGAGLPLAGFGREKKAFREYLLRSSQPVNFKFEGISYQVTIQDVRLFPQGYSAIAVHPELIRGEPSMLLMDVGGWTVDLMRLDNGIPNASTCRSLELGMIRCIDKAKEQVRRETGLSVTDAQVERVLAGQSCSMDENARSVIQKQGRIYTEALLSAATVFHSVPTRRTKNTEKHGTSCSQYRKDRAIPLSRGRFWKTSGRTLWKIPCAVFCGKNFDSPLSSRKPGRKIPAPRKYFIFWIPSHDSELFGCG